MRVVETFPAQKSADLTGMRKAVGFAQDGELVLRGEPAPVCQLGQFGVRDRRQSGPGAPLVYDSLRPGAPVSVPLYTFPLSQ